jgi:hypothetical protein
VEFKEFECGHGFYRKIERLNGPRMDRSVDIIETNGPRECATSRGRGARRHKGRANRHNLRI